MNHLYLLALWLAIVSNSILFFVLARRSERSITLISFIVLLLLINIWAVPQFIVDFFLIKGQLFISIDKISAIGYTCIPLAFFVFALSFTNRISVLRNYLVLAGVFLPALIFLYFAWNTNLIEVRDFSRVVLASWGYSVPTGPLFFAVVIWFDLINLYSLFIIFHFYRRTVDLVKKRQALWIFIATLIPLAFGTVSNGILPALHIHILPLAIPLTSIMAGIIGYAILRHGLFELTPLTILSSIGNGVITIDHRGVIAQCNKAAQQQLGLHNQSLIGKSFVDCIAMRKNHQIITQENSPLVQVLQFGMTVKSRDYFLSLRGKRKFSVECTISPIIQDDQITGAILIFRDITKEKELERNKNEFIGIASHELKTPLTSIKAYCQLLERRLKQSGDKQNIYFIANINEQLNKMMTLINELLNVDRIEEGRFILKKKKCMIDELINKIVVDFQYITESHRIIKKGVVKQQVIIDEERIGQVLINLLTNAVKYSPKADSVIVRLANKKDYVTVSVQDFGLGIPKHDQKRIFERFYRTSISRESNIVGFGLGLSICAEIIKRHNGKMWVKSVVGKGSTFYFSLPSA